MVDRTVRTVAVALFTVALAVELFTATMSPTRRLVTAFVAMVTIPFVIATVFALLAAQADASGLDQNAAFMLIEVAVHFLVTLLYEVEAEVSISAVPGRVKLTVNACAAVVKVSPDWYAGEAADVS